MFTVDNSYRYCVVCKHDNPADGDSYLLDNFATRDEADALAADFGGRVVYAKPLDLLSEL